MLAFVIGISLYTLYTLHSSSKKLEDSVTCIENSTKTGNWNKVAEQLEVLKKDWDGTGRRWAMLIDHIEIDNIENSLIKMSEFIESRNSDFVLSEAASLKQYIRHIPEKEAFKLKNIL